MESIQRHAPLSVFAVLLLMGCGKVESPEPQPGSVLAWQSGSRLRARVADAGDGAVGFLSWHDRKLDVDCAFLVADDGQERCLPVPQVTLTFEDPECQQAAISIDQRAPGSTDEWYAALPTALSACTAPAYSAAHVVDTTIVQAPYQLGSDGCVPSNAGDPSAVAVEIEAASHFVSGKQRTGATVVALAPKIRDAEDGASEVIAVIDVQKDELCGRYAADSGALRCVSGVSGSISSYFGDPTCTTKIAQGDGCGGTPRLVESFDPDDCSDSHLFAVGKSQSDGLYVGDGQSCTPASASDTGTGPFYAVGDEAFDQFPSVETTPSGSGRIVADRWGEQGRAISPSSGFTDTATGNPCVLRDFSGATRCGPAPADLAYAIRFSDSSCTVPIASWYGTLGWKSAVCERDRFKGPVPHYVFVRNADGSIGGQFHRVGRPLTGDVYKKDVTLGSCSLSPDPLAQYYEVGDAVDDTTFPALEERVE